MHKYFFRIAIVFLHSFFEKLMRFIAWSIPVTALAVTPIKKRPINHFNSMRRNPVYSSIGAHFV